MPWTYRVVRRVLETGAVSYGIHEAYDAGNIAQPHTISVDSIAPVGDTVEELAATLARMGSALEKPVLDHAAFDPVVQR